MKGFNGIEIIIRVEPKPGQETIGIKEDFATYCEKYGDVVKVEVEEVHKHYEQMRF